MSNTATTKPARKRTPRKAVETPKVETPETPAASTDLVPVEKAPKPLTKAQQAALAKNVERLNALTDEAQAGFQASVLAADASASAFHVAAKAVRAIRDEKLVESVHGESMTFAQYVETHFNVSRDLGDKYARAGQVIERLEKELGDKVAEFPLPTSEGQTRLLGAVLNADPKGTKKLTGEAWKTAFAEARTEAEKKGEKTGFIPTTVVPSMTHVKLARKAVLPVNGSTRASGSSRKRQPALTLNENASDLDKAVLALWTGPYKDVPFATFADLLAEGAKLNATHTAVREATKALGEAIVASK